MPGALGAGSFNGLSWGPGTKYHISNLKGWEDLPGLESSDAARPYLDGSWAGHRRLQQRVLTVEYTLTGDSPSDYDALVTGFENAMVNSDTNLPLQLFGSTKQVSGYVNKRSIPYDATARWRSGTGTIEFVCDDPLIYALPAVHLTTGLPSATGGFGFPFGFPFGFGGSGSGGIIQVNNAGNRPMPAILTISGPCSNPVVSNDTLGRALKFLMTVALGDTLAVDLDQRLVTLNGTGNRNNTIDFSNQSWFLLAPGNNTIRFNADTYQAAASLAVDCYTGASA